MKGADLATKIIHYTTLIVVAFILAGALLMITSAFADVGPITIWVEVLPKYANHESGYYVIDLYIVDVFPDKVLNHPNFNKDTSVAAIWDDTIWILTGHLKDSPRHGGCTMLWHEILHAKFWSHDDMRKKAKNLDCKAY